MRESLRKRLDSIFGKYLFSTIFVYMKSVLRSLTKPRNNCLNFFNFFPKILVLMAAFFLKTVEIFVLNKTIDETPEP